MEHLVYWIIVGTVAGLVANQAVPGEGPGGVPGNLIVGLSGALLVGWLLNTLLGRSCGGWIGSAVVRLVGGGRPPGHPGRR